MRLGIDLGTTYSVVAFINDDGQAEVIPTLQNLPTTPSVVYIDGDNVTVGEEAKRMSEAMPENVVSLAKRYMGTDHKFEIDGTVYVPQTISAMILKKLKEDAERVLNRKVTDAVITVPAYFGVPQRQATVDAGKIAGLNVCGIIEEPVAAAITYGYGGKSAVDGSKTVLVYDLGGGTFDVTLLTIESIGEDQPKINVISTEGDRQLGGADWDLAMVKYISEQFEQQHGVDFTVNQGFVNSIQMKCEAAKQALATSKNTVVVCSFEGKTLKIPFDASLLLDLTRHLLDRTEARIDKLLSAKSYTTKDVDEVLLVGGSTKLKMVRDLLEAKFGVEKIKKDVHADLCVAQGAALKGKMQDSDFSQDTSGKLKESNVNFSCPHGLGTDFLEDVSRKIVKVITLIPKDQELPCSGSDTFYTAYDGQTSTKFDIFENDSRSIGQVLDPDLCLCIGTVTLEGLPPGRPRGQPVKATFALTDGYLLTVTAVDISTGKSVETTIDYRGTMERKAIQAAQDGVARVIIQS